MTSFLIHVAVAAVCFYAAVWVALDIAHKRAARWNHNHERTTS